MRVDLAPYRPARLLLGGGAAAVLLSAFLGWSVGWWHGLAALLIFTAALVAVWRWAIPSDLVRTIELDEDTLVLRRASPTVTTIHRGDLAGVAVDRGDPADGRADHLVLTFTAADRTASYPDLHNLGVVDGDRARLPLAAPGAAASGLAELLQPLR